MSPLKLFRKYERPLLVVASAFLMVVFLLPGTNIFSPNPASQVTGNIGKIPVTAGETNEATVELQLLSRVLPPGRLPNEPLHWILLIEDARENGLYVSRAQAKAVLDNLLRSDSAHAGQLLQDANGNQDLLVSAIQHYQMVAQLEGMVTATGYLSEPRMKHFVKDSSSKIALNMVAVDSAGFLAKAPAPTPQQMQQQFDKYKDHAAGTTQPFGFGYRIPDRAALEWIELPLAAVAKTITIDEITAHKYYMDHPAEFIPADTKKADDKKADAKAKPAPAKQPLDYREVRDRIVSQLTMEQARRKQEQIVRALVNAAAQKTRKLGTDAVGYKIVPDGFHVDLQAIAQQLQKEFGVLPTFHREDRLLTMQEVDKLPGFGAAALNYSNRPVPVAYYINTAKAFDPAQNNPLRSLRLQAGVPAHPVTDQAGNVFLFVVDAAEPAHAPKSLDEVRSDVARDLRRAAAFQMLKQQAPKLLADARQQGLAKFAAAQHTTVQNVPPFSGEDQMAQVQGRRELPSLPVVGQDQQFIDAAFELAQKVQHSGGLKTIDPRTAIAAIPVDKVQKLCIVQLTDYQPVDIDTYNRIRPILPMIMAQTDQPQPGDDVPLSFESLKKRLHYKAAEIHTGGPQMDNSGQIHHQFQ